MAKPAKQCNGQFSSDTIACLEANRDREQWQTHPCCACGQRVGAVLSSGYHGQWSPETHWPSILYVSRSRRIEVNRSKEYASERTD